MRLVMALILATAATAQAAAPAETPALTEKGTAAFTMNCVPCHGEKGDGTGIAAQALNPKPRNFTKDPFKNGGKVENIFDTVTKGLPGTAMVTFAQLPEEDRWALAYHVVALAKGNPTLPPPAAVGKPGKAAKPGKKPAK